MGARPVINVTNVYVNNRYTNVTINRTVVNRTVNYTNINRYNSVHRDVTYRNVGRNTGGNQTNTRVNNNVINRNINTNDPRINQHRGREGQGRPAPGQPGGPPPQTQSRPTTPPTARPQQPPGPHVYGRSEGNFDPHASSQRGRNSRSEASRPSQSRLSRKTIGTVPIRAGPRSTVPTRGHERSTSEKKRNSKGKGLNHMKTRKPMGSLSIGQAVPLFLGLLWMLLGGVPGGGSMLYAQTKAPARAQKQEVKQAEFSTPEEAMQAIVEAGKEKERGALARIFGPENDNMLSGDAVEDNKDLEDFSNAVQETAQLRKDDDAKYTLTVGKSNWPFPIPIVKQGDHWLFETKAGIEEILNRRIGENELSAITSCRAYVMAQWEYFTEGDQDNDGIAEYAQKFVSAAGKHDGLYWETKEGENPSPLGKLVAAARAEGYGPKDQTKAGSTKGARAPYHGYYVKILTRQGPHAPGGKFSYIINENMIAGYALVAYPDKWGNSGVMTFIVSGQGRVYQKNLGTDTLKLASVMAEYDPDPSWKLVEP